MSDYIDFGAQQFLQHCNIKPSRVDGVHNYGEKFYEQLLYRKLCSVFNFKLPDEWKYNWFRFWLLLYGSIASVYTKEFGWICMPYGISKYDIYYNPKEFIISIPQISREKIAVEGVNGVIINCFDDYFGFYNIIKRYAVMLAECDASINVNLMNSKASFLFGCRDKKHADAIKGLFSRISSGEPYVYTNVKNIDGDSFNLFKPFQGNDYVADKILDTKRTIMNNFLTEIGINNANLNKRERLNSDEVNANNQEVRALAEVAVENIQRAFDKLNKISGMDLSVSLNYQNFGNGGVLDAD